MDKLPLVLLHQYEERPFFSPDESLKGLFHIESAPFDPERSFFEPITSIILEIPTCEERHVEWFQKLHAAGHTIVAVILTDEAYHERHARICLLYHTVIFPRSYRSEKISEMISPMLRKHIDSLRYLDALKLRSHRAEGVDSLNVVAHQWRQPINLISMEAINLSIQATLEEHVSAESIQKSTQMISEQSQRMAEILKNVLNMGKAHRGKEPFSINTMLHHVRDFFADQLQQERIEYHSDLLKDDISLYGYSSDLEEVLVNLIANAKDAFKTAVFADTKHITVTVESDANAIFFRVRDNAGGIPEAIQEKIFEPHFSTKGEGEGFGIGLHIARLIVTQEFKGSLSVAVSGGESTFTIRIPRTDASELKFIYS